MPATVPTSAARPWRPKRSHAASTAGTITRAAVHRPAFERIVEILAMRGGAVDHRRVFRAELAAMPERAARAAAIDAGDQRAHVIGIARGDAQSGDVDQQLLGACAHRRRNAVNAERGDAISELLGDRSDRAARGAGSE